MGPIKSIFAVVFLATFLFGTLAAYAVPIECPKQAAQKSTMSEHCAKMMAKKKSPCHCAVTGCNIVLSTFTPVPMAQEKMIFSFENNILSSSLKAIYLLPDTPPPRA